MSKLHASPADALQDVLADGMTLAVGGFGLSGIPADLIDAVRDSGVKDLTVVSNNMGVDGKGLGVLIEAGQVRKVIASYVGREQALRRSSSSTAGSRSSSCPQGTLAERLRAGGAGIPAFYTKTGVGTLVAEGKPHAEFDGETYVQERGIVADVALVHAHTADTDGNLIYRYTARNFNPVVATRAGSPSPRPRSFWNPAQLDPNHIVTPGVFVAAPGAAPATGSRTSSSAPCVRARAARSGARDSIQRHPTAVEGETPWPGLVMKWPPSPPRN